MTSENDIINELKQLDSPLAKYPRTMPYALPYGYFKDMEQKLTSTVTNTPEPAGTSMPFALPADYFEQLPGKILQAAKNTEAPATTTKRKSIWLNVRWAAAAMLVIAIGLGTYRIMTPPPTIEQQLEEIPYEDILAYVEDNIEDYETDNIVSYLNSNTTIPLPADNINRDAIEYYLQQGDQ